jgi:tetratricopeptide (TPR) repeat protein
VSERRTGNLTVEPLPQLLFTCYRARLEGVAWLDAAGGRSEIYFRQGYPVGVQTRGAIDQLGAVLFESQLIDEASLRKGSEGGAVPDGRSWGLKLIEQGLLDEDRLREGLVVQLRRRLHRLFYIERGSFAVEVRDHAVGADEPALRLQPRRAIYHGVRYAWPAARLKQASAFLEAQSIKLRIDSETLSRYGIEADDAKLAEAMRERTRTLAELVSAAAAPEEAVRALALVFHYTDSLDTQAVRARPTTIPDLGTLKATLEQKVKAIEANDLYGVLGLPPDASREQVKHAYFTGAKTLHPDRFASPGMESVRADVERVFRSMNEAYATLSDDVRRMEYLSKKSKPPPPPSEAERARNAVEAELSFRQGEVQMKRRDYVSALASFERAVQLNPQEGEHVAMLLWARVSAGKATLTGIKSELHQAIAKSPACARAHYFLGVVLKEEGELDRAIVSLRRAISLDSKLSEAESELRVVTARREKTEKKGGGLLDRFRKK